MSQWVGWYFARDCWHRGSEGRTMSEAARRLDRAEPGLPSVAYCLTTGAAPDYRPNLRGQGTTSEEGEP